LYVCRFTTVEGLLNAVREQLRDDCALWLGDSAPVDQRDCISGLLTRLAGVTEHDRPAERVTLVLDDPAGNSYIQVRAVCNGFGHESFIIQQIPNESGVDSRLRVDLYTRTDEQNDDLGLKHMKTENYSTD
jgi:zinc finger protein